MKKILILGLLIALCIVVSPTLADAVPAVSTDKADYYPWETVYLSGTGFTPGATVSITVEWPAPDSGIYQVLPSAVADTAGGFSAAYPLTSGPNGAGVEGTYIVIATDSVNGQSATTTFTDAIQVGTTTSLNPITTPLTAGQTGVAFSGKVSASPSVPDGTTVQFLIDGINSPITTVVTTNGDGSFRGTFVAPSRAGTYPFKARFAGYNEGGQNGWHWTSSNSGIQNVVVIPVPKIVVPPDITKEGNTFRGYSGGIGTATASGGTSPYTFTNNAPVPLPLGTTTIKWTVTDNNGATATDTQIVTVVDTTKPTITAPADKTVEGKTANGADNVDLGWPTVSDIVDDSPTVTNDAPSVFPYGVTMVTWTVEDDSHNVATAEQTITVVDGTAPVITHKISGTLGDNGWYTSDVTVTWTAIDPESAITPPATKSVTISADTAGETVSFSATSAGGTSTDSVTIKRDTTPPTITGAAKTAPNANGWYKDNVVVEFTGDDTLSGVGSVTPPVTVSMEGENQAVPGIVTDNAGNTAETTVSGINIDKTGPVVSHIQNPPANTKGWNNADVEVEFSATDGLSGVDSVSPAEKEFSTEGAGQSVTGTATDKAGNTASETVTVNIDKTKPTIAYELTPTANANGWNNVDVTVKFSATDGLSGVDSVSPEEKIVSTEGADQSVTGTATDEAGNTASITVDEINIDKTPPTLTLTYPAKVLLKQPVSVEWTASDAVSAIDGQSSGSVSVDTNAIGTKTGSMSVQDLAGNSVSKSWSVTIEYKYIGFLQPVDPDGKSVFKWKSTVPVKFQLTDYNGNYISTAKAYMKTAKITDQVTGDDIEAVSTSTATEGNLFRYDATSNQYIFNLATKPLSVGTYLLKAELGDGQTITQQISLK